jgi:hypothetical protein
MNPKCSQKTRRPVSYIKDTRIPSKRRKTVETVSKTHAFPSIKILTTNGTGNRVVVGFLVAFLSIGTAEFFSADVAGIGL